MLSCGGAITGILIGLRQITEGSCCDYNSNTTADLVPVQCLSHWLCFLPSTVSLFPFMPFIVTHTQTYSVWLQSPQTHTAKIKSSLWKWLFWFSPPWMMVSAHADAYTHIRSHWVFEHCSPPARRWCHPVCCSTSRGGKRRRRDRHVRSRRERKQREEKLR